MKAWELITLGATNVGCIVGGLVVGLLLDRHFDALPLCTLVGLAVGIVSGCLVSYLRVRDYLKSG